MIVNKVHYETEADLGKRRGHRASCAARSATTSPSASPPTSPTTRRSPFATPRTSPTSPASSRPRGVIRVPYMDEDIHDLEGLLKIDRYLFASESERAAMAAGRLQVRAMNGRYAETRVYTSGKPLSPQATNPKRLG